MAFHQRHRLVAEIGDFDRIAPEIVPLVRIGALRIERWLDGDFDPMRDGLVHETGILAAARRAVHCFPRPGARRAVAGGRMRGAGRLAEAKALLERLIAFESVSDPSNLAVVDFVEAYLRSHGLEPRRAPNAAGDKAAVLATIGPRVDGGVVLSGHTDVVPVEGQPWSSTAVRIARGRPGGSLAAAPAT